MTSFLARVAGEPVSLPSLLFSGIFARVNQQQVSLKIFTVLFTSGISRNEDYENNVMKQSGLE